MIEVLCFLVFCGALFTALNHRTKNTEGRHYRAISLAMDSTFSAFIYIQLIYILNIYIYRHLHQYAVITH